MNTCEGHTDRVNCFPYIINSPESLQGKQLPNNSFANELNTFQFANVALVMYRTAYSTNRGGRIGIQHSVPEETQHFRPLRLIPRMPNTRQYIFLQFCGFSA